MDGPETVVVSAAHEAGANLVEIAQEVGQELFGDAQSSRPAWLWCPPGRAGYSRRPAAARHDG